MSTVCTSDVQPDFSGEKSPTEDKRDAGEKVKDSKGTPKGGTPKSSISARSSLSPTDSVECNSSFENMTEDEALALTSFHNVMYMLKTSHYNIDDCKEDLIVGKCKALMERDYRCEIVINESLSPHYPAGIIVPVATKSGVEKGYTMNFDKALYVGQVEKALEARLRRRFLAPVILFDNKFICRSGTLAVRKTAFYEMAMKSPPPAVVYDAESGIVKSALDMATHLGSRLLESAQTLIDWNVMEKFFAADSNIFKHLKVNRICDLMVEYNKLFAQTISISSSEKLYEEIYKDLKIEEMPYPGCEFFASYKEAGRKAEGLKFDWSSPDVTKDTNLTDDPSKIFPDMDLQKLKEWDLTELTKNYLKIMLSYLAKGGGGLVVHCISGWDRTPLFISLLRMSLWADGVIHQTLDFEDMAYLTVAYDWYLFGHNFPDRLKKGEEVMHFCFNFLTHICTDEFSVKRIFQSLPEEEKKDRAFPKYEPGRREILKRVREYVLDEYDDQILGQE